MRTLSIVVLSLGLAGCASPGWFRAHSTGLIEHRLTPCPEAPRCRSSDADSPRHAIAPLTLAVPADQAWPEIIAVVLEMPRTRLITRSASYLHVEVDSPWGTYIDDLELHRRDAQGQIAVRSSGRIGWFDFHVNRDRIEDLRQRLSARGLVTGSAMEGAP